MLILELVILFFSNQELASMRDLVEQQRARNNALKKMKVSLSLSLSRQSPFFVCFLAL